jgi:hypothetical protein
MKHHRFFGIQSFFVFPNRCLRLVIGKQSRKNIGAGVPLLALYLRVAVLVQELGLFPSLEAWRSSWCAAVLYVFRLQFSVIFSGIQ